MRKLKIYLLFAVVLSGCDTSRKKSGTETNRNISRFENDDIVCYYHHNGGISCKWKVSK